MGGRPRGGTTWVRKPHITGLTMSASGICGPQSDFQHGDCTVCGKSFAVIKEETSLGYLEQTHLPGDTYEQRVRRRNGFQAGMETGSVIIVPGWEWRRLPPVMEIIINCPQGTIFLTHDPAYCQDYPKKTHGTIVYGRISFLLK